METGHSRQIANPRLTDVFDLEVFPDQLDFPLPRLTQDIPLCVDPFLLWASGDANYRSLHERLIAFVHSVGNLVRLGRKLEAAKLLAGCEEPIAMGLGYSTSARPGISIGPNLISSIIQTSEAIPQLIEGEIKHIEELQLVVPGIAEDRISDIACSVLKDYFVSFTAQQAEKLNIPTRPARLGDYYSAEIESWIPTCETQLPYHPSTHAPVLFAPNILLRKLPWINFDDYYRTSFSAKFLPSNQRVRRVAKAAVLKFNAQNYLEIEQYVNQKESTAFACKPDPLFRPLQESTIKSRFRELQSIIPGPDNNAARRYEDNVFHLLVSLLYPTLEFAENRVRTLSGSHIRDVIFYNDGKNEFWKDMRNRFDARQPVFELKNVRNLETEHVNQIHRYLDDEFGRFGVLVTRNPVPRAVQKNIVDLHSSKRFAILCLDDRDIALMVEMLDAKRDPADVVKKKFVEFTRLLPK